MTDQPSTTAGATIPNISDVSDSLDALKIKLIERNSYKSDAVPIGLAVQIVHHVNTFKTQFSFWSANPHKLSQEDRQALLDICEEFMTLALSITAGAFIPTTRDLADTFNAYKIKSIEWNSYESHTPPSELREQIVHDFQMFKTQLSSWSRRGDISREDNQAVRDMVKGLRDISLVEHRNHHSTQGSHHQEDVTRHPQWLADVLAYVVWGRSAFKNSPESESKPNESKQESSPEKQTQVPGAFPNSPDEDYE